MKYGAYLFGRGPSGGSACRPNGTVMNRSGFTSVHSELQTELHSVGTVKGAASAGVMDFHWCEITWTSSLYIYTGSRYSTSSAMFLQEPRGTNLLDDTETLKIKYLTCIKIFKNDRTSGNDFVGSNVSNNVQTQMIVHGHFPSSSSQPSAEQNLEVRSGSLLQSGWSTGGKIIWALRLSDQHRLSDSDESVTVDVVGWAQANCFKISIKLHFFLP